MMIPIKKYMAPLKAAVTGVLIALLPVAALSADPDGTAVSKSPLYVVSFTADWCPNCRILDPRVSAALDNFDPDTIRHIILDMTDGESRLASFDEVDGTVLAGVYGDHLGVTGIAMLTAADSGEKLGCATRLHSTGEIIAMITAAQQQIADYTALTRPGSLGACPPANQKQAL